MISKIKIIPFHPEHQNDVNDMMERISSEFREPIFNENSKKIVDLYSLPNNKYWVAIDNEKVIGTIGLIKLTNKNILLKSMFVDMKYRGYGISNLLLETITYWAIQNKCKHIFLGTMTQFTAGQRFYEKNKFEICNKSKLPKDFVQNTLDTVFYTKKLN